jgi:hypothetical protein
MQYGVASVSGGASVAAGGCAAPPANINAAINSAGSLLSCLVSANPALNRPEIIFNIFLSPLTISSGYCSSYSGEHDNSNGFAFGIIPMACNGSFNALTSTITHEMVEAATDPNPPWGFNDPTKLNGEIGDLCGNFAFPFLFGSVQGYWSNSTNGCVTGFANRTPVSFASPGSICGTGPNMHIVVNGTFGPTPWDVVSNQGPTGQSVYLAVLVKRGRNSWSAGNFGTFPPNPVGFGGVSWSQGAGPGGTDQIQIFGFNVAYGTSGQVVSPGDVVRIVVFQPLNGVAALTEVPASGAAKFAGPLFAGDPGGPGGTGEVFGSLQDSEGCTVQGASVSLSAPSGTNLTSQTATTDANGFFSDTFTAPAVAGQDMITVTIPMTNPPVVASASFDVIPKLDILHWDQGDTTGSQTTTLTGLGFDSSTSIVFGPNNPARVLSVSADHSTVTIQTPSSPLPSPAVGVVAVGATVNGEGGSGLQYRYIRPGVPDLQFIGSVGLGGRAYSCNTGAITVNVYAADGTPQTVPVSLSAGYAALWSPPISLPLGGHFVRSETVTSGSTVTIQGGGPITAVNPQLPGSQVSESFPVLTFAQCAYITSFWGQIGHGVFLNPGVFQPINPACAGDCGGGGITTVYWPDTKNALVAKNFVAIQGTDAAALMKSYRVDGVSEQTERSLIAANPFVMAERKSGNRAEFMGPAIQIERVEQVRGSPNSSISGICRISLSMPAGASPKDTYTIVHLRPVGKRQAWIADDPSTVDFQRRAVTAIAKTTGTYALVRISSNTP